MNLLNNKRSEIVSIILIIIVIVIALGWLINIGSRECGNCFKCFTGTERS